MEIDKIEESVDKLRKPKRRGHAVRKRTIVMVMALLIGALMITATAGLLTYYGKIETTVNVEQSLRLDKMVYSTGYDDITINNDVGNIAAGCCKWGDCHDLHLHSQACDPISVKISSVVSPTDGGLTTMIAAEVQGAGVDCSDYTVPSGTVSVIDASNLVAKAADGAKETLIVKNGVVGSTVISSGGDTIVAKNYLGVTLQAGIHIASDGTTVKGFRIKPGNPAAGGGTEGIYLDNYKDIVIECNDIDGTGVTGQTIGIETLKGATGYSNIVIKNNKIHDLRTGIYTNPHTGTIDIEHNYFKDCTAGIGGACGANVEYNVFDWDGEALGLDDGMSTRNLVAKHNNFYGDAAVNNYGTIGQNALNNWWDCDGIDISGNVNAGWNTWAHDDVITLEPNETVHFMIQYCTLGNAFGSYTSTVKFLPHT